MSAWQRTALAVFAIWLAVEGDIQLARAMRSLPAGWLKLLVHGPLWLALLLLLGHFASWFFLLSRTELSVIMPFTGIYYIFNAVLVERQLGESVGSQAWMGTFLISLGVLLVTTSVPPKNREG
ncbi:hypothetical protein ABS71_01100 [bacterium SCN 62-11]|nr:MAG: hypothetical protein ABS71_01100 [bacterium SCN 62-11]